MFEFLRTIISNEFYAFLTVITLWLILYFTLSKILKIGSKNWTRLEYIWIFIGLFGIMTLVDENKKNFNRSELSYLNHWIENDYKDLLKSLDSYYNCIKFNHNISLHTKQEFDSLQNRQNIFCEWTKETYKYIDSCYKTDEKIIGILPPLTLKNKNEINPYDKIVRMKENINKNLTSKRDIDKEVANNFWPGFKLSFGLLLVYFAFGLRLAIITNKLKNEKNKA